MSISLSGEALQQNASKKETAAGLVALDHSLYLDTEDYELEIEVETAEQEENFHQFIKEHGIVYKAAK